MLGSLGKAAGMSPHAWACPATWFCRAADQGDFPCGANSCGSSPSVTDAGLQGLGSSNCLDARGGVGSWAVGGQVHRTDPRSSNCLGMGELTSALSTWYSPSGLFTLYSPGATLSLNSLVPV